MGPQIERRLTDAGYRMLGGDESIERLILDILKTKNNRYLKAIPFLIYKYRPGIHTIYRLSENSDLKGTFQAILRITTGIFKEFNIPAPENIPEEPERGKATHVPSEREYDEFKDEFRLQLRNENTPTPLIDKQKMHAERELQMHLSRLFTKKEKHIIRRVLDDKPLSRTEYEYYSRKTKKKLTSILHLQDFARALSSKNPAYDEDLFTLKRKLEKLIEKRVKERDVSVTEFTASEDTVSIGYAKKDKTTSACTLDIGDEIAHDKHLLDLLRRYERHDFR